MLIGGVLMVGLAVASAFATWRLRADAVADTIASNHTLGVILAEQTARTFQGADLVLQGVVEIISAANLEDEAALARNFGGEALHLEMAKRLGDLPQLESVSIIGASGRMVNLTRTWPVPDLDLGDRPYMRNFIDAPNTGLHVSEPYINRVDGRLSLVLARPVRTADGRLLSVVTAAIRLSYFQSFFTLTQLREGTEVTILRNDGTILVHSADTTNRPGRRFAPGSPWHGFVAVGGGHYISQGNFDRRGPRFVSVTPLRDFPLVVNVFRLEDAALAQWRRQAVEIASGTLLAVGCLALLLWALQRQLDTIHQAQAGLRAKGAALSRSEQRLQTTLEHMNQGIIMVDGSGIISVCNRRAIELLDLPPAMMVRRPSLVELVDYQRAIGEFDDTVLASPDDATLFSEQAFYERRRPNGTIIEARTAPLPGGGMVRTYTDITARAAAEEMLGLAASHDPLTGLANRNGFHARLDAALAQAQRGGTPLSILYLDLDRFKAVNDTLGHEAGDRLLGQVALRLQQVARGTDVVARLGGDEFGIVLPGASAGDAEQVAGRLLKAVQQPYQLGEQMARIGVSIGIAAYPMDGGTAEQLLRNGDSALYQAKAAGRNCMRAFASEDGEREYARTALEADLRAAVELGQFTLAYQPICDAETGAPASFEALLRWHHPQRGLISPAEFIPIAEQSGLIIPLGHWVLATACAEATGWPRPVRVAVNLSPAQFHERDLVGVIGDILARSGLPPERLDLEITEGLLLQDTQEVVATMLALRATGIRMVLDDFGTAHSSLSYLRGFPFDAVKIDRSFMRALSSDRQARALVEAMLAMARALGLEVVGEGVETPEQLALLRHLHCDKVQGYLLGRPSPPEDIRAGLATPPRALEVAAA